MSQVRKTLPPFIGTRIDPRFGQRVGDFWAVLLLQRRNADIEVELKSAIFQDLWYFLSSSFLFFLCNSNLRNWSLTRCSHWLVYLFYLFYFFFRESEDPVTRIVTKDLSFSHISNVASFFAANLSACLLPHFWSLFSKRHSTATYKKLIQELSEVAKNANSVQMMMMTVYDRICHVIVQVY